MIWYPYTTVEGNTSVWYTDQYGPKLWFIHSRNGRFEIEREGTLGLAGYASTLYMAKDWVRKNHGRSYYK